MPNPTSFNSAYNPNVVKTALDGVVMVDYKEQLRPQIARAFDPMLANQESSDRAAEILEVFSGVGKFTTRTEEQDVPEAAPSVSDQKVFTISEFSKGTHIPKTYLDDEQWGTIRMMVKDYGRAARNTQDDNLMAVYRGGFATETTVDGAFLFSNSHTNRNGDTVDNLETEADLDTVLDTMITKLQEQKDQAGKISGVEPACLLVPSALFKVASETLDSELRPASADNDLNHYSDKYGIVLKVSPHLGASAGGSDTAAFLIGTDHTVMRYTREAFSTNLRSWEFSQNKSYFYQASFREEMGAVTYEGVIATNGTT